MEAKRLAAQGILADYRAIAVIRGFEHRLLELKSAGLVSGSLHLCCGQEAIAVGACRELQASDSLSVTYRGHGWAIARGVPLEWLFAELMGRDSRLSGGRGGSAYFCAADYGFLGENSIVGAGLPIAAGAALAELHEQSGAVSLAAIGDGAMNQGAVHEALNFAAIMTLPLIVICENNRYSELTPISAMIRTKTLAERGAAYGIPSTQIDGNEVGVVQQEIRSAVLRARSGEGPTLIEAMTERIVGHYDLDIQHYRPEGEIEDALADEPLARLRGVIPTERTEAIEREVEEELENAVQAALRTPAPEPASIENHVYA